MADLHPVLSREQAMEVLLESLFLPLPVYPTTPSGAAAASNLDLASSRTPAGEAIPHLNRQIRIASRTCSFLKLLAEKVHRHMGELRLYLPKTAPRNLAAKRKHEEMMLTEPRSPTLTYHQKRQLLFISQAIRDYTNDGPGQNSFQLEDAEPTTQRIWTYLTRHFGQGEVHFMIANALSHLHLLMRSSTPRLLSGIEQSQPSHAPGQGSDYFPENLRLHDDKQLDLQYFDLQALRRASTVYRVQQLLKVSSSAEGASPVKNGWRFQHQDHHLNALSYDQHLLALLPHLPHYQDQIREDLVTYRQWLLREINAEEVSWIRSMITDTVISRGELLELFEDALLKQVNSAFRATAGIPNPEDHSQDFQNSMALRFYQIINPLYDDIYEEHKPYAIVFKMLTSSHRRRLRSLLRAREAAILASPYRTTSLVPVCE